ncbi:TRAP transporter substrate-binding protein [Vibrio sp. E150_011]
MKNNILKVTLASALGIIISGCGDTENKSEDGPITLKMSLVVPDNSNYADGARTLAQEVSAATNDKINVEIFAGGQLGGERDTVELAMSNNLDIATAANAVLSSFIPEMEILDQAYLFDSVEEAHAAIDGPVGQLAEREARKKGLHIIGWMESGFRDTFSNKPIKTMDDFKGFTLRTMENKYHQNAFASFGAMPIAMPSNEVFTALQQGTIDGAENAVADCLASGFYEVTKNISYTKHAYVYIALVMSESAMDRIPEELREPFLLGVRKGVEAQRQYLLQANEDARLELEKKGVQFYDVDIDALRDSYRKSVANENYQFDPEWVDAINSVKGS